MGWIVVAAVVIVIVALLVFAEIQSWKKPLNPLLREAHSNAHDPDRALTGDVDV